MKNRSRRFPLKNGISEGVLMGAAPLSFPTETWGTVILRGPYFGRGQYAGQGKRAIHLSSGQNHLYRDPGL